jgi:hypothetical protein
VIDAPKILAIESFRAESNSLSFCWAERLSVRAREKLAANTVVGRETGIGLVAGIATGESEDPQDVRVVDQLRVEVLELGQRQPLSTLTKGTTFFTVQRYSARDTRPIPGRGCRDRGCFRTGWPRRCGHR